MGALLALNGMAALVFDPIDQGERGQYLGPGGWPDLVGIAGHINVGMGCILLGRNTARFEIWDGMRAIDYLQSRPEVDPAADRLHGQQRRRHANQLPDGAGRPHSLRGPKLLSHEPAEAAGHHRPAGLRTAPFRPTGFSAWTMPTSS